MYGKGQVKSHAYYTLARIFCHGHKKDQAALRYLRKAVGYGLGDVVSVRKSPFLRRICKTPAFRRLLRFAYSFTYEDRARDDVTITNTSGFPWTGVRTYVNVDGEKWHGRKAQRMNPGSQLKIPGVTAKRVRDIRQIMVLVICDQGRWRVRHQPRNQTYADAP
jgi:hypothetical protein